MKPEKLVKQMADEHCCTLDNCRTLLRTVLLAIENGYIVHAEYSHMDNEYYVELNPEFTKFLNQKESA